MDFKKISQLHLVYSHQLILQFAKVMIGLFAPIYLYVEGYSFTLILLWAGLLSLFQFCFTIPSGNLAEKLGLKRTLASGVLLEALGFVSLYLVSYNGMHFFVSAMLLGVGGGLYWTSFHSLFSIVSDHKNRGKETSFYAVIAQFSNIAGPLVGALVIIGFGFSVLFPLAIVVYMVSVIPLFFKKELFLDFKVKLIEEYKIYRLRTFVPYLGRGILGASLICWPLFIFLVLSSYGDLGGLVSFRMVIALLTTLVVGYFLDKGYFKRLLKLGVFGESAAWIIMMFAFKLPIFILAEFVYAIFSSIKTTSFDTEFYEYASGADPIQFTVLREMFIQLGIMISCLIGGLVLYFVNDLRVTFVLGIVGSFMYLYMRKL